MSTKMKKVTEEKSVIEEIKKVNVDPTKVKRGHLHAFVYWGTVESETDCGTRLQVKGLDKAPNEFGVHGKELVVSSFSADQYEEEVKASMTEVAAKLITCFNRPFTVCFVKQENEEERILRGRLVQPEPLLGRSQVEDLDITSGSRFRLVDHRTIKWLIVEGVKYVVGRKDR